MGSFLASQNPYFLLAAALLAAGIGAAAAILRMLTITGAIAAAVVGFLTFGLGGAPFAVPLLTFFITSSLLSKVGKARKAASAGRYEKSSIRDAGQVLANGSVPAALAVWFAFSHNQRQSYLIFLAALAAVNADTWATELGGMVSARPWLVTTFKKVDPGTSGGVTLGGLAAALAGAFVIALSAWFAWPAASKILLWRIDAPELLCVTWAGFVAAYADSVLGATVQAQYKCTRCGQIVERKEHCGVKTKQCRGVGCMNNDAVNLAASACGAVFGWALLQFFAYPL